MIGKCAIVGLVGVFVATKAIAYELTTHARITNMAFLQSILVGDQSVFVNLGIENGQKATFGSVYFDMSRGVVEQRVQKEFDWSLNKMPDVPGLSVAILKERVAGWLMRGAIREDDSARPTGALNSIVFRSEWEPFDDPYFNFNRWCNHFFDPYHNRAFVASGVALQLCYGDTRGSAPVWATGLVGPFQELAYPREDAFRRNHFTVLDAREAMWRALTGYDRAMAARVASDKATRDAYWATAFRALGAVLHLNQDMAQPQHTRNEDHGAGHAAWYEKHTDGRAKELTEIRYNYRFGEIRTANVPPIVYEGYPVPRFRTYAEYWSTGTGTASLTGKGLADYSSRGFLTPEKSIGNSEYPLPPADPAAYQTAVANVYKTWMAEYLMGRVRDSYLGVASDPIKAVKRSVWGDALRSSSASGQGNFYTFDEAVYIDRSALLIPRAVAYSTGLLNHFFRGKLQIGLPNAGFFAIRDDATTTASTGTPQLTLDQNGFTKLRLKLKNTTPPVTPLDEGALEQPMSQGVLVAILKYRRSTCDMAHEWPTDAASARYCLSPVEELAVSKPLQITDATPVPMATPEHPDGDEYTFDFASEPLPADAWNVSLQVVYRGKLGDESDAVVVATKDISEPAFMTFMNTTDHFTVNGKFYNQQTISADPAVFASVTPSCVTGSPGNYRIHDDCYNRPDRFFVRAGSGPTAVTIAAVGNEAVMPRRLIRLAFLGDLDTPVALNWAPGDISCALPDKPLTVPAYRAQLSADNHWSYSLPNTLRGVKGWRNYLCYEDLGIVRTPPAIADTIAYQLDNLTVDEAKPMPVTISGW